MVKLIKRVVNSAAGIAAYIPGAAATARWVKAGVNLLSAVIGIVSDIGKSKRRIEMSKQVKDLLEVMNLGWNGVKVYKALRKNGIGLDDLDEAVDLFKSIPAAVDGIENVPTSIEELDTESRQAVEEWFEDKDIPGDKDEAFKTFFLAGLYLAKGVLLVG